MDPISMLVAAWLVGWLVVEAPAAIADAYVARKAAKAGEWDFINGHEARKDDRAAARAARRQAWAERIFNRGKAADSGEPKRAGLGTLAGDVYHGMCEDALERRAARRDARDPYDPTRPTLRQQAVNLLKDKVRRQRDDRGDTTPLPDDEQIPGPEATRATCPECGQTVTRTPTGWGHPGGQPCPRHLQPRPKLPAKPQPTVKTPDPVPTQPTGGTMTAPTAPTIADVQTNEAARSGFEEMHAGAAQLAEAARLAEEARKRIAAVATAAADGMAGVKFDQGATDAVSNINDTVHDGTLAKWSEVADQIGGAAKAGLQSLEKYRDAEDTVASNNIDARTLEPTAS